MNLKRVQWLLGIALALFTVVGPVAYWTYLRKTFRNFRVVQPDVLYRSGQMSIPELEKIINEYGIRTVVTLREAREPGDVHPDIDEEQWCRSRGYRYFRLPPRAWHEEHGTVPAQTASQKFCRIMSDPSNHPVLIHCFAGRHRTGAYVAIYRMELQGWSNDRALREMKLNGYDTLDEDEDIHHFLVNYIPNRTNAGCTPDRNASGKEALWH